MTLKWSAQVMASAGIGLAGGWVLAGSGGAVVGAVAGAILGALAAIAQLRMSVTLVLMVALVVGAVIGQGIVHALCLPEGCPGAEAAGAALTAVGAVVAVGLVTALVARSFEEYNESAQRRRDEPGEPRAGREEAAGEP